MIKNMWKYILLIIAIIPLSIYFIDCTTSKISKRSFNKKIASKNFNGIVFQNPVPTKISINKSIWFSLRRWITCKNIREPDKSFNFQTNPLSLDVMHENSLKVIWIGHSTLLISIDGKIFITDPVWSTHASPVPVGPKRFFNPPISLDNLPRIDGVIISHNHYDHLDSSAVKKLAKMNIDFYLPLGVGDSLRSCGIPDRLIHEFDWWDSMHVGTHTIIAAPARHFSRRGLFDRNKTLWAAWVLLGPRHRVFYGADGGLFPGFETIGRMYGPFDMTFLEIGGYDSNWPYIHLSPDNAIIAHNNLKGKLLIPIHWGTFNLALHPWTEPAERIIVLAQKNKIALTIPEPGQIVDVSGPPRISYWWR